MTCFKKLSEICEKHLHKGARIAVIGTLDQQKWETDEGAARSTFQLIANTIEFIKTDGRGFEEATDQAPFYHPIRYQRQTSTLIVTTGRMYLNHTMYIRRMNMTTKELQKRNAKAESLRVLQTEDGTFYVESAEGKIMYHVIFEDHNESCTCAVYARNIVKEPNFKCKHLLSVMNCLATGDVHSGQFLERSRPKLDERWIIEIEGSQFVKYAGLLDLGHQKGISQIEVEPLQLPTKDNGNFAICKATVVSKLGETFTDIGDANPNNCSSKVARHLLRLASTRAIGRCLEYTKSFPYRSIDGGRDFGLCGCK